MQLYSENEVGEDKISKYQDYLLITEGDRRVIVVDLTSKNYQIIKEVSTANDFYDPQKYVMNGVNPSNITNISSNYYLLDKGYWYGKKMMFRTFCELDLFEMERVSHF